MTGDILQYFATDVILASVVYKFSKERLSYFALVGCA